MTNRREFLQIGIAASALPLASQAARAAGLDLGAAPVAPIELYRVVYDLRFPESVAFARRAAELGAPTQAIEGDMTRFWYDDLYHRWKQAPVAIAGLTAHGPMFCFERLAWDQQMRVVFRAEHRPSAGCVRHEVSGPVALLHDARDALARSDWSARMADLLTRCPRGRVEIAAAEAESPIPGGATNADESLYSWLIAPAYRA
jgi:hypothetical protein